MIRSAHIDDAAAIATIHVRGWQTAYAGILPADYLDSLSIEKRTLRWQGILGEPRSGTLVAVEAGTVVGWVDHGTSRDPDCAGEAEVYAIYVAPENWGRGIGSQLLMSAEREIVARGVPRISLWVLEQNVAARRFYERRGFAADQARKQLEIGGRSLAEWRYAKSYAQPPEI
jgi:ribosomal protein S18 acetylase RimI-like enzyme